VVEVQLTMLKEMKGGAEIEDFLLNKKKSRVKTY
jgi:hypothetical protein